MKDPLFNFKYKQVIIIRRDLEMSPAKLGVQIAHGAIESYRRTDFETQEKWHNEGMRKIVLMVPTLNDLKNLMRDSISKNSGAIAIIDYGLTELEPHTHTGISYPIMLSEDIDKITRHLKLYK